MRAGLGRRKGMHLYLNGNKIFVFFNKKSEPVRTKSNLALHSACTNLAGNVQKPCKELVKSLQCLAKIIAWILSTQSVDFSFTLHAYYVRGMGTKAPDL